MSVLRTLVLSLLLITMPVCAAGKAPEPVAIVYSLAGEASLATTAAARQPLRLFDRLLAGTLLEVGPGSRVSLAFASGLRYELDEGSRVTLGRQDLASRTGPVRTLPPVPAFLSLAPIAKGDRPGPRAGAVRIRAERITGLYPLAGAAVLPGEIFLRFQPVRGAGRYRVEVQDDQGRTLFETDSESPPVKVEAGTLRPGLGYRWTVRTLDRPGPVARGNADLVVVDEDVARTREETRKILKAEGPGSLPLLAEIDLGLGLWLEAREELQAALDDKPEDPALREALAEVDARLEHEDDRE